MRFSRRSLSSGKGMMGRATRLVSSRKILVAEKGMAYRKVGSLQGARGWIRRRSISVAGWRVPGAGSQAGAGRAWRENQEDAWERVRTAVRTV